MKRDIQISLLLIFSLCIVIYITNWNDSKENRKYRELQEKIRVYDLKNAEELPNYITWGIKNKFCASGIGRDQKSYYTIQDTNNNNNEESKVTYMLTVPTKYAVEVNLEMVSKRESDSTIGKTGSIVIEREMVEFAASVFDLETGELLNTIYIDRILKLHNLNVMPFDCTGFVTCNYNGKPCLAFDAEAMDGYDNSKSTIYIDLESSELFEEKYYNLKEKIDGFTEKNKRYSDLYDSDERYSVENFGFWEGYRKIHLMDVSNTIENNEKINYMFPDLKENYKKISNEYNNSFSLDIVLSGNPSDDEILNIIESDISK